MFRALILMGAAEALSLAAFNFPILSLPLIVIAGIAVFVLSWKNLEWGIYILFGELFFGSRGHLLEYDLGFVSLSLRLVIFAAVFVAWVASGSSPLRWEVRWGWIPKSYWLLLLVIGFGIINGYLRGNSLGNIFNDANGYLYFLILPAVLSVIKTREQINNLLQILASAIVIIAAKTFLLFVWFSLGLPGVATAYHWIINQDFGEITGHVGSASRIFMQSQFYALMGLFIFSFFTLPQPLPSREGNSSPWRGEVRWGWQIWLILAAALLSIIMSLSRSFWLGAIAGGMFAIVVVLWQFRASFKAFLALGLKLGAIAILEIAMLYGVVAAGGGQFADSVSSRTGDPTKEAAGGARLLLLPELVEGIKDNPNLGAGFGKLVTYKSYLPDRVTPQNPDGAITNFAFEWGFLDIALKIGIVGLLVYLLFIARIFKLGWVNMEYRILNMGMLAALIALMTLNITTPYLNHPLGIGFLIFLYSIFHIQYSKNESSG